MPQKKNQIKIKKETRAPRPPTATVLHASKVKVRVTPTDAGSRSGSEPVHKEADDALADLVTGTQMTSGGGGGGNKMRIRDHMDDILEARGYYRKHVARDDLSLFRAVADVLLHSQQRHAALLRHCLGVYRGAGRSRWRGRPCGRPDRGGLHADLRDLSDLLGVAVDVLESNQPDITTIRIEPRVAGLDNDDEEEDGAIMQLERLAF